MDIPLVKLSFRVSFSERPRSLGSKVKLRSFWSKVNKNFFLILTGYITGTIAHEVIISGKIKVSGIKGQTKVIEVKGQNFLL